MGLDVVTTAPADPGLDPATRSGGSGPGADPGPTKALRTSRSRRLRWASVAVALLLAGISGGWFLERQDQGQAMHISGIELPELPRRQRPAKPEGLPVVSSVSPNGRYFLDQYGKPLLVQGDSPWSLLTDLSPDQAEQWFNDREEHGFNAAIVSLIGARKNGAPDDDGSTFDRLRPFTDGDILRWEQPYWDRVTDYLKKAADHGITVFLYPIDGWTIGHSFVPTSIGQCQQYGAMVADRFRDLPNIVWMSGGDYFPRTKNLAEGSDVDHCIHAMLRGIREVGDGRPFSIQLGYEKSISSENPYWAKAADWNFVYTYFPTYHAVLEAYERWPSIPAILGEANYEGENNQKHSLPTTDETLRRQVLWALTSGAAGEFAGSDDWEFHNGWEKRLDTRAVEQIQDLRELFSSLAWWKLIPDSQQRLVTSGRGTEVTSDEPMDVLDSDYVTAARTPDGSLAVIYLPTSTTISVNRAVLAPTAQAAWIDPTTGARRPTAIADTLTTPGRNAEGDADWILLLTS